MKKHLTKFLAILLAMVSIFALTACNGELDGITDHIIGEISEQVNDYISEEFDFDGDNITTESVTEEDTEDYGNDAGATEEITTEKTVEEALIAEDGTYTSKEDVALYIYTYGCLPSNFITKNEARDLGWEGGSLEPYAPGMCIGGDRFGNYEGLLPEADGRSYTECDIDTLGADKRGAKRIVFSNDGLIYYTEDHYESFELLYGEE